MSQRIVTACDLCETDGADTYTLSALGHAIEVDLCDEHAEPLRSLVAELVEVGRDPTPPPPRLQCPYCPATLKSADSLQKHVRRAHGDETPPDRRVIAAGTWDCPTCGKSFASPQGLGAHRSRAHGYRRPTD